MNEQEKLLKQIQEYAFTATDLGLFLDTNPQNRSALKLHCAVTEKLEQLKEEYQKCFGPLTANQNHSETEWKWIQSPWPWEN